MDAQKKMSRTVVLFTTDWHAGHANGPLAPGTTLSFDGKRHALELTSAQDNLVNLTNNIIAGVERFAGNDSIIFCHGGDIVNGNRFAESMVMGGGRMANQVSIALQYFAMFAERLPISDFYSVYGTDVHTMGEGSAEEIISDAIEEHYKIPAHSSDHALINVGGAMIDVSHHGPGTGGAWTQDNPCRNYLLKTMYNDCDVLNRMPADVYLRGHVHNYGEASARIERRGKSIYSALYVVPSMCLMNSFARKVSRSQAYTRHGALAFEVVDGAVGRVIPMMQAFDARTSYSTIGGANLTCKRITGKYSRGDGQLD